jgi:hypothetical protein
MRATGSPHESARLSHRRRERGLKAFRPQWGAHGVSKPEHWTHGFPLAFAVIALTAAIIPFGYWAALGLLCLLVVTIPMGERR